MLSIDKIVSYIASLTFSGDTSTPEEGSSSSSDAFICLREYHL